MAIDESESNVYDAELEPIESAESDTTSSTSSSGSSSSEVIDISEAIKPFEWTSEYKTSKPDVAITDKKVICFDVEATGTDPWDYKLLVCSFWDLSKPISEMVTFAGWDEQKLTQDIADYLNAEQPDEMVCYNNGYDQRALLSRFMLYKTPVPGWNKIKQIDVMEILKRGTTQSIYSSQAAGAEEEWLYFFFGEKKPYNIDECFEGVRQYDLTRFILRNRTCVESEGCIYKLFRMVTDEGTSAFEAEKPTVPLVEEAAQAGLCLVKCPACNAVNQVRCGASDETCWRCLGALPKAEGKEILKESIPEYDFSKVGLKAATSSSTKKSTSKKS